MSPEHLWNVWNRMLQASPSEVGWGLLSSTLVCAALGVVIALVLARVRSGRLRVTVASRADGLAVGAIALMVGALWIGDIVVRGYVLDMSAAVSWWRFALAPAVATAGIAAWGVTRRTARTRRAPDAATTTRRTWTTFGPRRGMRVLAVTLVFTAGIAIVFGQMSTALDPGLASHVAWEAPNVTAPPIVMVFPGWAYGIPLLAGLVALAAAVMFALHRNAVRPYPGGARLVVERSGRSAVARDIVSLAVATVLVALGGMLGMARSAAMTSMTVVTSSGGEASVQISMPHADLIMVGGLAAPMLEIAGCAMLTLFVFRAAAVLRVRPRRSAPLREVGA